MKRFIIIVLDSLGVGELPDAAKYDSLGANTLCHIAECKKFYIPQMQTFGLANITSLQSVKSVKNPLAAYGKMAAKSAGMDTTSGHWEIAGLILSKPLPTFPNGFPPKIINLFVQAIGRDILGNEVASGTEIIQRLGTEHVKTGNPIIYTSADSVFQIAAHEEIVALEQLYDYCHKARIILQKPFNVGRVIARPFLGNERKGFYRTKNRKDFSLNPPSGGLLEKVSDAGIPVISIGKIYDIFAGQSIDKSYEGHTNSQSEVSLTKALLENNYGLIFANFVDFDSLYGHRNDSIGYRKALEKFDKFLTKFITLLKEDDILAICADHGNDPCTRCTNHNREYVPLLVYGKKITPVFLGTRSTFADLGQTAVEYLGAKSLPAGISFLNLIIKS